MAIPPHWKWHVILKQMPFPSPKNLLQNTGELYKIKLYTDDFLSNSTSQTHIKHTHTKHTSEDVFATWKTQILPYHIKNFINLPYHGIKLKL